MRRWILGSFLALLLASTTARADFSYTVNTDPLNNEGLAGLHLGRASTDHFAHGISWDIDGLPFWQTGLDQTLDYSYPGVSPTPPDLVLAYRCRFLTDSLRMRWDDARLELGPRVGHPTLPFQFAISAGTPDRPLGGLGIGTYSYQYGLYLYNRDGRIKRNTISLQNLFGFQTDTRSVGYGDFQMFNYQAGAPVFTVDPTNRLTFTAGQTGFFGAAPVSRPLIAGSWSDGTAVKSVLQALVQLGLVQDGTTP